MGRGYEVQQYVHQNSALCQAFRCCTRGIGDVTVASAAHDEEVAVKSAQRPNTLQSMVWLPFRGVVELESDEEPSNLPVFIRAIDVALVNNRSQP